MMKACLICGKFFGKPYHRSRKSWLRANHVKKFADYPELRLIENNGITICRECDIKWVLHHENEWESYFNFLLLIKNETDEHLIKEINL